MMKNFWGHLKTVTKHRFKVMIHCFKAGIYWQGLTHDLSKFTPTEFLMGIKYYQGTRSPNEGEREDVGYSTAWMHHKGRNKHHFEYWVDIRPTSRRYGPVEMPYKYLVEMFCDRVAASKVYKGKDYDDKAPLAYYIRGHARDMMHPSSADQLEELLTILANQGEKAAFDCVKSRLKEKNACIKSKK